VTRPPPSPDRWLAQFVALAAIWGSSFLFIKVAVRDLAPIEVAFARVVIGALVLLVVLAVQRVALPRDRRLWGHLAVAGLLVNAAPFTLFAYGETHVSSVLAGIYNAATPLLTVLVALAVLPTERPTRRRVLGILLGFAGVLVVLGPWHALGGGELTGQLLCLGAAVCYGVGFPYTRRYLAGRAESAVALSAGQLLCASALLAVATAFLGSAPTRLGGDTVASVLALGALGTGVAYILNYAVLRRAGVTTAATVTYLIPLFSTILGVLVLGEALSWNQPLGAAVVLLGVALSQGGGARVSAELRARPS
jgi:drug/metabolite transporter (DMT)-like permease